MQNAESHSVAWRMGKGIHTRRPRQRAWRAPCRRSPRRVLWSRMRTRRIALEAVLALLLASPARAGDATGAFAPYEDLLEVVADLTWHLHDDTYRFPAPKDPTGHDLYQLSLERLQSWETRYPGRLRDVTAFGPGAAPEP